VFLGLSGIDAVAYVSQGRRDGLGFNGRLWHESETLEALGKLRPTGAVYTNAPEAVYVHLSRLAEKLPQPVESATGLANPDYLNEVQAMERALERGGMVVLFELPWRNWRRDGERVEKLGLRVLVKTGDGVIYGATGRPTTTHHPEDAVP